jgi:hypothetical protein
MALTSGTRLGPYEIVSPLGAGGPPALVRLHSSSGEVSPKPSRDGDDT